jgi:ABC-type transporter Mla maintaining outer membrane lipid asymmetry ATPase subunit MlaF
VIRLSGRSKVVSQHHGPQEIRKRIGMLFQANALFDNLTVFDNHAFPLRRLYAPSESDRLLTATDRIAMMHRGELVFDGTTEQARSCQLPLVRQFIHGLTEGPP